MNVSLRLIVGLILVGLTVAAAAQTIIYFESGAVVETDKDVYLSDDPLYTATGGRNSKLVIEPAEVETGEAECPEQQQLTFGHGDPVDCAEPEPEPEECDPDGLTFGGVCVEEDDQGFTFGGS